MLLRAFGRIAERNPDWCLRIVGDGELRERLICIARTEGLQRQVEFAGLIRDVAKEYGAADIYVVPSLYESFGLATAEALAAGLPAIGFADCPGTNELIVDGLNGTLVEGRDRIASLGEGLHQLMNSPARRRKLGSAGPKTVESFNLYVIVDRWEEMLFELARLASCPAPTVGQAH